MVVIGFVIYYEHDFPLNNLNEIFINYLQFPSCHDVRHSFIFPNDCPQYKSLDFTLLHIISGMNFFSSLMS